MAIVPFSGRSTMNLLVWLSWEVKSKARAGAGRDDSKPDCPDMFNRRKWPGGTFFARLMLARSSSNYGLRVQRGSGAPSLCAAERVALPMTAPPGDRGDEAEDPRH